MKKKNSAVRSLEQKANTGSVKAAFQLYDFYSKGKFVDKDLELAKKYSEMVLDGVSGRPLRLSSIYLKGFRGFAELKIDLREARNLAVFCGSNGAGKSSVLDAMSKSLGWISNRIQAPTSAGKSIELSDINRSLGYSSIIADVALGDSETFQIYLSKSQVESDTSRKSELSDFARLSEMYRLAISVDSNFNLPLIASYDVERALDIGSKDIKAFDEVIGEERWKRLDGYRKSLTGTADFKLFFRWFKDLQDVINSGGGAGRGKTPGTETLKNELDAFIKNIPAGANLSSELNDFLTQFREESNVLKTGASVDTVDVNERFLRVVSNAVSQFLPGFNDFRIQYEPVLDMLVDKNGTSLSVLQLSQGEKSLLALVADIARRLVLLNPSREDPLQGDGIVLIDEVDLHLHPEWQQQVILQLLLVFPNIQFLISTHSPQVLSTVPRGNIRVLSEDIAGIPNAFSYGEPSNDVLQAVMGVDPQPPVPEKALLDELTSIVDQGDYESSRAKQLLENLNNLLSPAHPQIQKIQRSIRRQKALKK